MLQNQRSEKMHFVFLFLIAVDKNVNMVYILSFAAKTIKKSHKSSVYTVRETYYLWISLLCFFNYFVYFKIFFIDDKDINFELKSNLKAFSIVLNTSSW